MQIVRLQLSRKACNASNVALGFSSATKWPDDTPMPFALGAKVRRQISSGFCAWPAAADEIEVAPDHLGRA